MFSLKQVTIITLQVVVDYAPLTSDIKDGSEAVSQFKEGNYSKALAHAIFLVPFMDAFKPTKELVPMVYKYSDEVAELIDGTFKKGSITRKFDEIITLTKSGTFKDAMNVAMESSGTVSKVPFRTGVGPNKGKIVGFGDKVSGYRLDWSEQLGVHINWWKDNGKVKGAIPVNMNKEVYESFVDKLTKNFSKREK